MVQRYDITKANEGLGLWVTPNGKMDLQLEKSLKKVNTWSERLHRSFLNQKEAYIGANTTIFKTIEYVLPGTLFTEAQCRILERALYRHLMGKLGLTTKFPLAYNFGPHEFQGAALLEMYMAQMIGTLMVFLYHANIDSQLHTTFILSIEAL